MSVHALFWTILLIELTFAGLDFAERRGSRETRYDGEQLRREGMLFLIGIAILFTVIQYAALALAPRLDVLAAWSRDFLADAAGAPVGTPSAMMVVVLSIVLFYVAGLWDYLFHRFASHSRFLWFTHENHHLPNQVFVGMPGLFSRPFAVASVLPVVGMTVMTSYVAAIVLGIPLWDWTLFQIPLIAASTILTSSHSSFLRRSAMAHRVMSAAALTSPQEHVLHHTVDLKGNFGNFTTLWDRLFGTYLDPMRAEHRGHACGLPYDQDFVGTLTLGHVKIPAHLRERYQLDRYCNVGRTDGPARAERT